MRVVLWLALLLIPWVTAVRAQDGAEVYFMEPSDGAVVESGPWVKVTGRVRSLEPNPAKALFDVMIVIDTSGSTRNPSGLRVSPEGGFTSTGSGFWARGGDDSILAAEVGSAIRFLSISDRATTRVGVITFAGGHQFFSGWAVPGSTNAWLEQPLTFDYEAVRAALLKILRRGPNGGTDMGAGLRLAIRELLALQGALSPPRPDARKVALLLTDGFPTLPFGSVNVMDPGDLEQALNAGRVAAKGGIVIHTFCLGREALSAPMACAEVARATGGIYTPVQTPGDIVNILPNTPIGNVELVAVRNATTGQMARSLSVSSDGIFIAEVPLAPGGNRLVVELHGGDGLVGSDAVVVHYRGQDVKIEVGKERERKLEIQIEQPRPRGGPLDPQGERPGPAR